MEKVFNMSWPIKKLGEIILITIFIVFAGLFFLVGQYWLSFLTLILILIAIRIEDLNNFSITNGGFIVELNKADLEVQKTIKSNKPVIEKIKTTQKLIDEIFRLGYQSAGGKFSSLNNVKITRDEKGNITGVQYDEN